MNLVKSKDKNNVELDKILLKLLKKHKITEIFDALKTDVNSSKKSKKTKKKSKNKGKKRDIHDK
jgi:hypothetical protein